MYTDSKRTAVILGASNTVWSDYAKVLSKYDEKDLVLFAVNDISLHFNLKTIDHIVSLHSEMIAGLKQIHQIRYLTAVCTHGYKNADGVDMSWYGSISNIGGTSALFAVEVALKLGLRDIVICGVTLDNRPHYYEDQSKTESTVFDFGRSGEYRAWTSKFEHELKDYKHCIKGTTGVLSTFFGGIDGE